MTEDERRSAVDHIVPILRAFSPVEAAEILAYVVVYQLARCATEADATKIASTLTGKIVHFLAQGGGKS